MDCEHWINSQTDLLLYATAHCSDIFSVAMEDLKTFIIDLASSKILLTLASFCNINILWQ